jgi:hypothetical protein
MRSVMRARIRPYCLALGFITACQQQAGSSQFTTTMGTATAEFTSTLDGVGITSGEPNGVTAAALSTGAASSESGGTTPILDVGPDHDLGDGKPVGCRGKIDFLFVISRYAGMEGFQTQLLDAFPKFIDTIQAKFADFDYHIMVVDGDPYWGLSTCDELCPTLACKIGEPCCPLGSCPACPDPVFVGDSCCGIEDYPCDYQPTFCDAAIGAGVVFPAGDDAANKSCNIDGGRRYMVTGQSNLKDTFACAAQVGSSGRAWVGEALTAAVNSNTNDPGGCNPGFLRKDALLMVTFISNTYDSPIKPFGSTGTPETWTEAVAKAKNNDLESVVLLNIGDTTVPGCHEKDRLCQMVKLFPYAMNTEIWADDYGPFFDEATDLVETACAGFTPPQ